MKVKKGDRIWWEWHDGHLMAVVDKVTKRVIYATVADKRGYSGFSDIAIDPDWLFENDGQIGPREAAWIYAPPGYWR